MYEQRNMNYQAGVDFQKFIETLAKRKGFILVFFLSATLFSLGLTYFVSEKYQAAITIFYHPIETSLLRQKETESFGAPVPIAPFKVISQTLRDAIRNEAVLQTVVEKLNLDQDIKVEYPTWYERMYHETKDYVKRLMLQTWQFLKHGRLIKEDPKIAAIKRLRKDIDIIATRDSYIYILKVKDKHPARAAKIVDLAGREMVEWLNKQQQGAVEERVRELEQKVKNRKDEIASLQELKKNILEENNLVSIPEETTKALTNLYQLELDKLQISAQIEKEETQVAAYEEAVPEASSTYIQSGDIKNLRSQKLFGEIELKGLKAKRKFMEDSIKDFKERLDKLPSIKKKLDMLDMDIRSTTREHEHLKDLHTESSAQVMLAQSETRVLHRAVVPSAPVQPIKVYHVGLTGVLSLTLAIGLAFLLDFLNAGAVDSSKKAKHPGKRIKVSVSEELKQTSQVLKDFARELGAKGGSLFLRRGNSLVLAESLDPGHAPATIPLPLRKGSVFEQVMSSGQPIVVEDIEHKIGVHSSGWKGYSDNSLLAFPLSGKTGEPVGIVSLHNKAKDHFTQKDKERGAELLASKLSKLVPSAEQLATALQKTCTTILDKEQKAFHLDEFARSLDAEGGSLFLRGQDRFVLAQSLDPGHAPAAIPLPLRKGSVFERAMDAKEPLLIRDIEEDVDTKSSGWTGYKDRSSLVFPIIDESGGIAGIVSLHNRRSGPFTEKDKQRGAKLLASHMSGKTRRHWLSRILRYPAIIIFAAILAGLVFYFLLKIGF